MSYCIYLRKSRADLEAEAHGEGETLARHEHACFPWLKNSTLRSAQSIKRWFPEKRSQRGQQCSVFLMK